ncbi:hypothetical protein As57867_001512, partial [Aphanomyces stellatus]
MVKIVLPLSALVATTAATHPVHVRSHQSSEASIPSEFPSAVAKRMDVSVNPCDDFFKYACGGWYKQATLSNPDGSTSTLGALGGQVQAVITKILQADKPKLGAYYKSCLDVETRNALGVAPLKDDLQAIFTASSKEAVLRAAATMTKKGVPGLVGVDVSGNPAADATRNTLYLLPSTMFPLDTKYYTQEPTDPKAFERAYRKYVSALFQLAGYNKDVASASQDAVLKWDQTLQKIQDVNMTNVGTTVYKVAQKYPLATGPLLQTLGLDTSRDDTSKAVLLQGGSLFATLEELLQRTSLTDLKALVAFKLLDFHALDLTDAFDAARGEFDAVALGETEPLSMDIQCRVTVPTKIASLVDKYYTEVVWSNKSTAEATVMVKALEVAFNSGLDSLDWLDKATLANAKAKMAKLVNTLGSPDTPELYTSINFDARTYIANIDRANKVDFERKLASVFQPVDRLEWVDINPSTVNAQYVPSKNQITVTAAIMQSPLFEAGVDPAQNFGSIGAVIGHEIVHGYDNSGRQYDADGNKRVWWT